MADFRIEDDRSDEVISAKDLAVQRALETIGIKVERYAKELCVVDTGNLRNSITHQLDDNTVAVGSGVKYAPYVELGTGKYFTPPPDWIDFTAEKGRGLPSWVYQDEQGNWHRGYPVKARPFLRPAVENHINEFEDIVKRELES